jgi:hypothetical protein
MIGLSFLQKSSSPIPYLWILRSNSHIQKSFLAVRLSEFVIVSAYLSNWKTGFNEDDPLLLAILRRSINELSSQIRTMDPETLIEKLCIFGYGEAFVSWYAGLEYLILNTPVCTLRRFSGELWQTIVQKGNLRSIKLLLEHGVKPTFEDWSIHFLERMWCEMRFVGINEEPYNQVCLAMAQRFSNEDMEEKDCVVDRKRRRMNLRGCGLYHTSFLTLVAAQCLWDFGHRDIDTLRTDPLQTDTNTLAPTTPLWAVTTHQSSYPLWGWWPLVEWLLEKGANLAWIHPTFLTTPAHVIGSSLRCTKFDANSVSLLDPVLLCDKRDQCSCYCSYLKSGCRVLGCTTRHDQSDHWKRANFKMYVEPHISALIDGHRSLAWASSAVLRVMTFEKLSLTHTCCVHQDYRHLSQKLQPTKEEARNIFDIERDDIDLLDKLMEEFDSLWATYRGTFAKFIKRVWKPKMRSVLKEKRDPDDIYRETGVVLKRVEPHELSESEPETSDSEDTDPGSSDDEFESASESGGHEEAPMLESEEQATSQQPL